MSWWLWLRDLSSTKRGVAWMGVIVVGVEAEEGDHGDIMYKFISYLTTAIYSLNLYCTMYHFSDHSSITICIQSQRAWSLDEVM